MDRISALPEDLILQILSLLLTEDAIATSLLSKQWKSLWKKLPKVKFSYYSGRGQKLVRFSNNVSKTLLSCEDSVLQSLHLSVSLPGDRTIDIMILIEIVIACNVRKLVLELGGGYLLKVPKSLYNCEKLETLKLSYLVLKDVPSSVCLKNLRTLHLQSVDFQDKESIFNLLSGCPNLEDLALLILGTAKNTTLIIAIPSLQRLKVFDCKLINDEYVINAPSLKYLKIFGLQNCKSCLIENLPELEEAHISNGSVEVVRKILRHLTSAKRLCLKLPYSEIMKFPNGTIFYQLTYLKLKPSYYEQWDLLTLMLDSSPKLQVLKLISVFGDGAKWNQPKKVPECLLFHLETFIWKDFYWDREGEMEIVRYILGNTNHLKKAFLYTKAIDPIKRVAMVKDLNTVIMASNSSCQLQVI